jgi:hypothetical protein
VIQKTAVSSFANSVKILLQIEEISV